MPNSLSHVLVEFKLKSTIMALHSASEKHKLLYLIAFYFHRKVRINDLQAFSPCFGGENRKMGQASAP